MKTDTTATPPMPTNPEVEMLREALEMWAGAFGSGSFTSQTKTAQRFRAELWEKTNAALAAPAPKQKLRPMSEAPRDGERILLYFELDDARTGYYCKRSFPADDPWVVGRDTCGDHDFIGYLPLPEVDL